MSKPADSASRRQVQEAAWRSSADTAGVARRRQTNHSNTHYLHLHYNYPRTKPTINPAEGAACAKNGEKRTDRTSRQTQAGISHITPAHRGRHVQNRIRRREARRDKTSPVRRRSNHTWMEDQAGKRKCANIDALGGWRVHTADDTPSRNAATRSKHCNFMCQGDIRLRAATGSSRNGTTQTVAGTTGIRLVGNAVSNTASAWSDPEHTRKRSSRRRASAT